MNSMKLQGVSADKKPPSVAVDSLLIDGRMRWSPAVWVDRIERGLKVFRWEHKKCRGPEDEGSPGTKGSHSIGASTALTHRVSVPVDALRRAL